MFYESPIYVCQKLYIGINHRQVSAPVGPLPQLKFTQGNSRLMIRLSMIVIKKSYSHLSKNIRINHRQVNAPVGPLPR